jgi:hypothetical protein
MYKSVMIILADMSILKTVKNIGTSGTSKVIPVSQEVKALGLGPKDSVVAALAIPGSQEDYALSLAATFVNPNVHYINNMILCTKDQYPNGQNIENRLNKNTYDEIEIISRRLTAMQYMIDTMREFTKNKIRGPYAYYKDELRTFIARFDPDDISDPDENSGIIKDLMAQIDLLKACLESPIIDFSPLLSVKSLQKYFDRAMEDAFALFKCAPENRVEYCKHLNEIWSEEVSNIIYRDLYFVGLIVPFHTGESPVYDCPPEFMVIPAPTQRMAKEKVKDLAGETLEDNMDSYVCALGPYTDESECRDLVSYLKLKWKMEVRTPADQSTLSWTKNIINEYNITIRE